MTGLQPDKAALARALGIIDTYTDVTGQRRDIGDATRDALLAAMGVDPDAPGAVADALASIRRPRAVRPYLMCTPGQVPDLTISEAWCLTYESGATEEGRGALPALDIGIHAVEAGGDRCWLLVAPPALPLPPRGWGVTLPLYGLRGPGRGGVGDYRDLAVAAQALGRAGAGFVGINPVHAGFSSDPAAISPYSPSHRRRLSTQHVAFDGADAIGPAALVDYRASAEARAQAAAAAFASAKHETDFARWRAQEGDSLTRFATYEALAEGHGAHWCDWPAALQDPAGQDVRQFAATHSERVTFHAWMQFRAETQLAAAATAARASGMAHGLYLDLAVGTHPYGAETWSEPGTFAFGVSLGAPPDAFAADGQRWNLAPFNPRALIDQGFAALAATLRCQLRHARLLRIDHILGFERAFWVPDSGAPGGYVRMPRDAMLAVARIEAARAGVTIVGEDLGNIPDGLREALGAAGILGCRVAMFEGGRAAKDYPAGVLASFGTHDLPTWQGWRAGADIDLRATLGTIDASAKAEAHAARANDVARMDAAMGAASGDVDALHAYLAATPARLVALQIEDILGVAAQPNLPGTIDEYPNWRHPLPVGVEDLTDDPRIARAAAIMAAAGR
ncbi:MAG: 4-alpha-glucanotransferase [Pseudomonadota bacterium]